MELVNKKNVVQSGAPSDVTLLARRFTERGRPVIIEDLKFLKSKEGIPFYEDMLILLTYFYSTEGRKSTRITTLQIELLGEMHLPNRGVSFLISGLSILGANPNNVRLTQFATPNLELQTYFQLNLGTLFIDLKIILSTKDNYNKIYLLTRLLNKNNAMLYRPVISVLIKEPHSKIKPEDLLVRTNGTYIDNIIYLLEKAGVNCEGIPLIALTQP